MFSSLPEEIESVIFRWAHEMCMADVKREMLRELTTCTCTITMGDHEQIDRHLGINEWDIDAWRDAHGAEGDGLHCFHVDHCEEHPWWHNEQCLKGPYWPASMYPAGWLSGGHFMPGVGTLRFCLCDDNV